VIVDELHALAENKRGAHLMLSLERLERKTSFQLVGSDELKTRSTLTRIGLVRHGGSVAAAGGASRRARIGRARSWRQRMARKSSRGGALATAARAVSAGGLDGAAGAAATSRQLVESEPESVIVSSATRAAARKASRIGLKEALPKLADQDRGASCVAGPRCAAGGGGPAEAWRVARRRVQHQSGAGQWTSAAWTAW
jgi:ATP-dependent Lhr-like helicase